MSLLYRIAFSTMVVITMPRRFHLPLLGLIALLGSTRADELRTLAGKTISGSLISANDTEITLGTKDGPVTTPLSQVLALDIQAVKPQAPVAAAWDVRLLDDTVLRCKDVRFEGQNAMLTLPGGTALKLPVASITWVVRGIDNIPLRKKFEEVAKQNVRRDRIVIVRDGELNPLEGTLGDIDAQGKTIQFKRDGADPLAIQLERLHGLIYYRPEGPSESAVCKVHDMEGNVLSAVKVAYKDKSWSLTTTFGATLPLPEGSIAKLDFNMGKLTYLSDLEPAKVVEKSGIGLVVRHKKDANLDGEPIVLDRLYGKGLSMHAYTELEFNLAGKFKELKGVLGIDLRTGADSQPLVTIYCDGEKRFSETITPKAPRPLNMNVKDVTTLRIVVSSRNDLDLHDHVTFAEARVSQ